MIIFVDARKHCHLEDDGAMTAIETDFFNGKCKEYVEGYCCDIQHEAFYAWRKYSELEEIQTAVDRTQAEADEQIMGLLDTIEELIIGG